MTVLEAELASRRTRAPRLYVGSEVGTLRRVLLHRPGLELRRLVPANKDELLFDDVLWAERARREHDAFADTLAEAGVEVLYLQELLAGVLAEDAVRADVVERTLLVSGLRPKPAAALRGWLQALAPAELAARLVGGVAWQELPFAAEGLAASAAAPGDLALGPLPGHLFTRDTSAWVAGGVSMHATASPVRRRELLHLDAIYRHHPLFAQAEHEVWSDGLVPPAGPEGRDLLVIGNDTLLVGMGARAHPAAVEALAERLFANGSMTRVIALPLPAARSTMRLDSVLTMVDRDAFTVHPQLERAAWVLTRGAGGASVERADDLFAAVARALDLPKVRLVESDDGNDVLAVRPGVVVAYERNVETNARLREAGIEVIAIEGFELGRVGGPRRLSCPLERDGLAEYD